MISYKIIVLLIVNSLFSCLVINKPRLQSHYDYTISHALMRLSLFLNEFFLFTGRQFYVSNAFVLSSTTVLYWNNNQWAS